MQKQNNIPLLRFPEFKGEWIRSKMSEIAQFSKGKGISKADIVEDGKLNVSDMVNSIQLIEKQ